MKKIACLLLALVMLFGLIACTPKDPAANTPKETDPPKPVETTAAPVETTEAPIDYTDVEFEISWWGSDARHEQTIKIVEEFEKLYPGLTVTIAYAGYGEHFDSLTTRAAGNDLPDVFQMDISRLDFWAKSGQLLCLDDMIADGSIDFTNMAPAYTDGGLIDGKMYGEVCGVNAYCMFYDTKLLEDNGIKISTNPTYSEIFAVAKEVYEKTGVKAELGAGWIRNLEMYLRSLGADQMNADNTQLGMTAQQLVDFWTMFADAYKTGALVMPGDFEVTNAEAIAANYVWCFASQTSSLVGSETAADRPLGIITYPEADNRTQAATYMRPAMLWSASANTEYPELVAAWMDFYANSTVVYDISGTDRGVPISSEIRTYLEANATDADIRVNEFLDYLAEDGNSSLLPAATPSAYGTFNTRIVEIDEQIKYDLLKPEDFLATAESIIAEGNAALAEEAAAAAAG